MPRRNAPIKLEDFIRRRPRKITWAWVIGVVLLLGLAALDQKGAFRDVAGPAGSDVQLYDAKLFRVLHVVDGDTLDLDVPDGDKSKTRIRVWGINAPEVTHPPDYKPAEPFGAEATTFLRRRVEGKSIRITLETSRIRDRYGRLLAHIEMPDGKLVSEELVAAGLARADDRWKHRYVERFALVEEQAQRDRIGIWSKGK